MNISKVEENKQIKRDKLLSAAYELFIQKGVTETSIDDITRYADIAKGTFYLYFKDKWDIKNEVVKEKSKLLLEEALINTYNKRIINIVDKLINITDYLIKSLSDNKKLTILIGKDLSSGLFNKVLDNDFINIKEELIQELKKYNNKIENPEIVLYFIFELIGSTLYNSIVNEIPLKINEFKPFLFEEIKRITK